jgi:hypothetical protein
LCDSQFSARPPNVVIASGNSNKDAKENNQSTLAGNSRNRCCLLRQDRRLEHLGCDEVRVHVGRGPAVFKVPFAFRFR